MLKTRQTHTSSSIGTKGSPSVPDFIAAVREARFAKDRHVLLTLNGKVEEKTDLFKTAAGYFTVLLLGEHFLL